MTRADFDPARLRIYLADKFGPSSKHRLERIEGGQSNPTYFVTWGDRDMVLRKQPRGPILKGAHAVDREYRVQSALYPTDVPVAKPILFEADAGILGTPFYLMERVEGRVFPNCALPEAQPAERRALWMGLARAMAAMHKIDPADVGLSDYGRPGNYFERQILRWSRQWAGSPHEPIPDLDVIGDWLRANLPPDDGAVSLAHGDFRMGNVIFHPTDSRVVAILDWELSTLGHPLADLAFCALAWHTAPDEYGGILGQELEAACLPDEADFLETYNQANPGAGELTRFHKVFALFRFAVIWVGIADRIATGTAAGADAGQHRGLAAKLARRGVEVMEGVH